MIYLSWPPQLSPASCFLDVSAYWHLQVYWSPSWYFEAYSRALCVSVWTLQWVCQLSPWTKSCCSPWQPPASSYCYSSEVYSMPHSLRCWTCRGFDRSTSSTNGLVNVSYCCWWDCYCGGDWRCLKYVIASKRGFIVELAWMKHGNYPGWGLLSGFDLDADGW